MANAKGQGRKPKPSNIAKNQMDPLKRLPAPPRYLSHTAKLEWKRSARLLMDAGLLASLDLTTLAAYCSAYARHMAAELELQIGGLTIIGVHGGIVSSPYVAITNQAISQMAKLGAELGMTPASRVRLPQGAEKKAPRQVSRGTSTDPREALKWDIEASKN